MNDLLLHDEMDVATRDLFVRQEFTNRQRRHLQILNRLTSTTTPASTAEICELFGKRITPRQVQRDLEDLSRQYDIQHEKKGKAQYWSAKPGGKLKYFPPVLDENAALAFHLAKELLRDILPESITRSLAPWFAESKNLLARLHPGNPWYERLASQQAGLQLDPPEIDPEILNTVYRALQQKFKIRLTHNKAPGIEKEHVLLPAGIVASNQTLYLLAYNEKYEDYTTYALHRVVKAVSEYLPANLPEVDEFQEYVEEEFNQIYYRDEEIALVVDFHPEVQRKMLEYMFSDDQQIKKLEDQWLRVSATVDDTHSLRSWLLSYGNKVRLIGPDDFVAAMDELRVPPPPPPLSAKA